MRGYIVVTPKHLLQASACLFCSACRLIESCNSTKLQLMHCSLAGRIVSGYVLHEFWLRGFWSEQSRGGSFACKKHIHTLSAKDFLSLILRKHSIQGNTGIG